jgi:lysophospholipase L1-like esterase
MKTTLSKRSLLWIGLALVAAAPLLDAGAVLPRFAGRALAETPAVAIAERVVQALAFAGGIAVLRARRSDKGPFPLRAFCSTAAALAGMQAAVLLFASSTGILELIWAGTTVGLLLLTLRGAVSLLSGALGVRRRVPGVAGPLLAVAALTITAALLEALLLGLARRPAPSAGVNRPARLVMPESLGRREAQVAGAHAAWWWQGQLHVFDKDGLRRTTPLPAKIPGVFRIAAFGDSLTYGYGVAAEEAWPAQLEQALAGEFRVEVINLGICGIQSEEVLGAMKRYLPVLDPDLVLYGACLNDFLPAGRGQYAKNRAWHVDFPGATHLENGTRLGALAAQAYDKLLMRLGVRADFITDILRDFENYQGRFARDVAAMNRLVAARGLPPVMALVLHQHPDSSGREGRIGRLAEGFLGAAGMTVVPSSHLQGRGGLQVSPWEGHPSAEAHRIYAGEFLDSVRRDPRLGAFRRSAEPDDRR